MASISLDLLDWSSIVGAILRQEVDDLNALLGKIDRDNDLTRYYLYVKWQDAAVPRPGPDAPIQDWPPWRMEWFTAYEPFTRQFVEEFVDRQTSKALYILVTDDPSGDVGWYTLEEFF